MNFYNQFLSLTVIQSIIILLILINFFNQFRENIDNLVLFQVNIFKIKEEIILSFILIRNTAFFSIYTRSIYYAHHELKWIYADKKVNIESEIKKNATISAREPVI